MAYIDHAHDLHATVKRLEGGSWVEAGNAGFTLERSWGISITTHDGTPFVANDAAEVMGLVDGEWAAVGSRLSFDNTAYVTLRSDSQGKLYAALLDEVHPSTGCGTAVVLHNVQ